MVTVTGHEKDESVGEPVREAGSEAGYWQHGTDYGRPTEERHVQVDPCTV